MGFLKIKVNNTDNVNTDWETIDSLNLTSLKINDQNIEEKIQSIADNAAVSIYIEVYSKQFTSADKGTYLIYKSKSVPATEADGFESITDWFAELEDNEKTKKGFLIEHRTTNEGIYHLPYYWNGSTWVLLNAIWG